MTQKKSIKQAEENIKKRELQKESDVREKTASLLQQLNELTGKEHAIYIPKKQNSKVAFAQLIQHNIQFLVDIQYLTTSEKSFLFDIGGNIDFKTNIIVERDWKNQDVKKRDPLELPKAASVNYIADLLRVHRTNASKLLKGLENKGILGKAGTGTRTEDGRFCTVRTWFVNPNIMYCGDKSDIDMTVQMIFRGTLINLKDQNGKKVLLPVKLFV